MPSEIPQRLSKRNVEKIFSTSGSSTTINMLPPGIPLAADAALVVARERPERVRRVADQPGVRRPTVHRMHLGLEKSV